MSDPGLNSWDLDPEILDAIRRAADQAYERSPGRPLSAEAAAYFRRLLPAAVREYAAHGGYPVPALRHLPASTRFPAAVERLVRERAGYRCEACGVSLTTDRRANGGACLPVVRQGPHGIPATVMTGPANAVLLCDPCGALTEAGDPDMSDRGFRALRGHDPRLEPMLLTWGGGQHQALVWRTSDGVYSVEPPLGCNPPVGVE
jgi:hypothetical protein